MKTLPATAPRAVKAGALAPGASSADATEGSANAAMATSGSSLRISDLPTLQRFSTEACRDKFAVASATPAIVKAYDVDLVRDGKSTGFTKRTSYVIGQDGRVKLVHSDMDYKDHVRMTLDAVKAMKGKRKA